MPTPSITAYLDFRAYLRDWLTHRKELEPGYSYAAFAAEGGCSKAALANVLSGNRHPRPDTLDAFARAMGLSPAERNVLGLLAELDAAPDVRRRRDVLERLLDSELHGQTRHAEVEPGDAMRYLRHWYVPAIRELATRPGFRAEPEWIAATLTPSIRVDQAREALDTLLDLGFVVREPDGRVSVREVRFRTANETFAEAAEHVHRHVVPEVLRHFDTDNASRQHLLAHTFLLSPDQVPEAKQRLNTVFEQVATQGDDPSVDGPRTAYLMAVQLLPLSEPVE
jgi:uncharacterized protein (TIGR02147 family)